MASFSSRQSGTARRPGLLPMLLFLVLLGPAVQAQDTIIKTNKETLITKVVEVDELFVKYKRFTELDGPIYSIRKDEVFVIIYKTGRRETFDTAPLQSPAPVFTRSAASARAAGNPTLLAGAAAPTNKTADGNVNNDLVRALVGSAGLGGMNESYGSGAASGFIVDLVVERRLMRNYLNYGSGFSYTYIDINTSNGSTNASAASNGSISVMASHLYVSGYLPLNRMMGNVAKQNLGFFPFVQLGLGVYRTAVDMKMPSVTANGSAGTQNFSSTDFSIGAYYSAGVDYKFGPKFGVTLQTWGFSGIGGGINFKL